MNKETNNLWNTFRQTGLLWWVNRSLHLFGWTLMLEIENDESKKIINAYPIRTKFRGFSEQNEEKGFITLSKYIMQNATELEKEANE